MLAEAISLGNLAEVLGKFEDSENTRFIFTKLLSASYSYVQLKEYGDVLDFELKESLRKDVKRCFIKINQFRMKNWSFKEIKYKG